MIHEGVDCCLLLQPWSISVQCFNGISRRHFNGYKILETSRPVSLSPSRQFRPVTSQEASALVRLGPEKHVLPAPGTRRGGRHLARDAAPPALLGALGRDHLVDDCFSFGACRRTRQPGGQQSKTRTHQDLQQARDIRIFPAPPIPKDRLRSSRVACMDNLPFMIC